MAQKCGLLFLGTMATGRAIKCLDLSTLLRWDIRTRDRTDILSSAVAVPGAALFGKSLLIRGTGPWVCSPQLLQAWCSTHMIWDGVALPVGIGARSHCIVASETQGPGRAPHLGQSGDTDGHTSYTHQHGNPWARLIDSS